MQKKYFFGIGILLLIIAAWGIFRIFKPHRNVEGEQPVSTLTAADLYRDFLQDETAANKKWVGKVIEIKGIISAVSDAGNNISINLEATPEGGVNCSFLKKDLDPGFNHNKGDSISIKGKCTGFLMDVNMVDCVVSH